MVTWPKSSKFIGGAILAYKAETVSDLWQEHACKEQLFKNH